MIRERKNGTETEIQDEFSLDENSGISKEDQQDILTQIEKIATESRMQVSPEVFHIKPLKKGVLFPIIINLAAVLVLAVGIFTLYLLFRRGEEIILEEKVLITSTEGKLLEELKRESDNKLREKNSEIEDIQNRLSAIDKERQDLQANMDSKIQERESALRKTLEDALAAEKQRLKDQGLSEEDINAKIADLENKKQQEFDENLEAFKKETEAERLKAENNLKIMQDEYSQSLNRINTEKDSIQKESLAREAELKSRIEEKEKALESEKTKAEAHLALLEEQALKTELVDTQLIGFYNTVKGNIKNENFEDALENLSSLRSYLDEESVISLPGIANRREVEFFVIDSLNKLIKSEMKKEEIDTSSLIEAANQITAVKDKVKEADKQLALGETVKAENLYQEALSMIPEVEKSYLYFTGRKQVSEDKRRDLLDDYLSRTEASFNKKDYAGTVENFTRALGYLPREPDDIQALVDKVRLSGIALDNQRLLREDSLKAATPLKEADTLLNEKKYDDAILRYADIIATYPRSNQVAAALNGIKKAAAEGAGQAEEEILRLETALQEKSKEAEGLGRELVSSQEERVKLSDMTVPELKDRITGLEGANEELAVKNEELEGLKELLNNRISDINERLDRAKNTVTDNQATITRVRSQITNLNTRIKELQSERDNLTVERDNLTLERDDLANRLAEAIKPGTVRARDKEAIDLLNAKIEDREKKIAELEEEMKSIQWKVDEKIQAYSNYAREEDYLLRKDESLGLLESKVHLNAFLESLNFVFPDLYDRIAAYDMAYEKAGRLTAIDEIRNILLDLSLDRTPAEKLRFVDEEIINYRDDPDMLDILTELRTLIEE
jgi:DNA repair exonuclease SbcCD ATPase subunit